MKGNTARATRLSPKFYGAQRVYPCRRVHTYTRSASPVVAHLMSRRHELREFSKETACDRFTRVISAALRWPRALLIIFFGGRGVSRNFCSEAAPGRVITTHRGSRVVKRALPPYDLIDGIRGRVEKKGGGEGKGERECSISGENCTLIKVRLPLAPETL